MMETNRNWDEVSVGEEDEKNIPATAQMRPAATARSIQARIQK